MVEQWLGILQGKLIYAQPRIELIGFPCTPLCFYPGTFVMSFPGEGFFASRLIQILSLSGSSLPIYGTVIKQTASRLAEGVCSGFSAVSIAVAGYRYDLARVDFLVILLVLLHGYTRRYPPGAFERAHSPRLPFWQGRVRFSCSSSSPRSNPGFAGGPDSLSGGIQLPGGR